MLLGSPNVWTVDQRTTALLTNRLKKEGATSYDIQRALYLAALSQFCIYVPTTTESEEKDWPLRRGDPLHNVKPVKNKCTLNDFHNALRARGKSAPSIWAISLSRLVSHCPVLNMHKTHLVLVSMKIQTRFCTSSGAFFIGIQRKGCQR